MSVLKTLIQDIKIWYKLKSVRHIYVEYTK